MPTIHYIRSYPSFPSVIPIHTASSLRVTHPSAMIPLPEGSLLIDLHVLSILSAFILSQDQTLHSIFISLHYLNFFFLTWRLFLLLLFSLSFLTHSFLLLTRNILPNPLLFVNSFFEVFFIKLLKTKYSKHYRPLKVLSLLNSSHYDFSCFFIFLFYNYNIF